MKYNILSINRPIIFLVLIFSAIFLCQSVFAEDPNAVNITVKDRNGNIVYQKVIPNDRPFYKTIEYYDSSGRHYYIILNYTVNGGSRVRVHCNSTICMYNISFGKGNIIGLGYIMIRPVYYNFPPSNTTVSSSSSTKTPIPIGAYLITTAFFTYILYRKSKT